MTLRAGDLVEAGLVAPERLDEVRRVAEQFAVALTDEVAAKAKAAVNRAKQGRL